MAEASATIEAPELEAAAGAAEAVAPTIEMPAEQAAAPDASNAEQKAAKGEKKGKKDKKGKKGAAVPAGDAPSVAAHPRAARSVARAKGWGGLAGFVIGGYLSLPTYTLAAAGLRALIAGIAAYVAVWAGAVFVWRRLVMLEIKAREQQLMSEALAAAGLPAAGASGVGASSGAQNSGRTAP